MFSKVPRLFIRMGRSVTVIAAIVALYLVVIFLRLWTTSSAVLEYDNNAATGALLPNGAPNLLKQIVDISLAVADPAQPPAPSPVVTPIVAVIVPASAVEGIADESISGFTKDRLQQGLRMALLTGAPWLMVSGTTKECSEGVAFLLSLMRKKMKTLFAHHPNEFWTTATPNSLNATVRAWECVLGGQRDSFDLTRAGQVPMQLADGGGDFATPGLVISPAERALRESLETSMAGSSVPQSSRDLAAFLVARMASRSGLGSAQPEGTEGASDDFEVFTGSRGGGCAFDPDSFETAAFRHAPFLSHALWRHPRLWQPANTYGCEFGPPRADGGVSDEPPPWLLLPGIVTVPVDGRPREEAADLTASVLRTLVERSVLSRKRLAPTDGSSWWLLNKTSGVVVLASPSEVQRVKLLYQAAFRRMQYDSADGIRDATTRAIAVALGGRKTRASVRSVLPAFLLTSTSLRGGHVRRLTSWVALTTRSSDTYVLPAAEVSSAVLAKPFPSWTSYKTYVARLRAITGDGAGGPVSNGPRGSLDTFMHSHAARVSLLDDGTPPPDAMWFTLVAGRYAHYLYYNYCRYRDAVAAQLFATNYLDFFTFARDFAADIADGRIDWTDLLGL